MGELLVPTQPAAREFLEAVREAAGARSVAALWFPKCAHVLDPLEVVRAFASAATQRGAAFLRHDVRALRATGHGMQVITESGSLNVSKAIVCTGVWSAPLAATLRVEGSAGGGARLSRADAGCHATRRRPHPVLRRQHRRDADGGAHSRHQLHGIRGRRRATRPAQARVVARRSCAALGYACDDQVPALGRPATGAAGLSTRHRSRGRRRQTCCTRSVTSTSGSPCAP